MKNIYLIMFTAILLNACAVQQPAITGLVTSVGSGGVQAKAYTEQCKPSSEQEIAALFERWNQSLQTGDPHQVVKNYAVRSILLATLSNQPRLTPAEKKIIFIIF